MIVYERDGADLVAVAVVRVGTGEVTLRVPLRAWEGPAPGPAGLAGRPVVVLPDPPAVGPAVAGSRRSGRLEPALLEDGPEAPAQLLRSDAEVLVATAVTGELLAAIRAIGGRPIPALPFDEPRAVERMLDGCPVDLDLPVPAIEDARERCRDVALGLGLDRTHHLVEVDPRPAFDELGRSVGEATLGELAAAAAGVLAGRVAAANRRWREGS